MKLKLTSILCITLSGDSLITVSLIWLIIKFGGDTRILGLFLFINTVISYLSQVFLRRYALRYINPITGVVITRIMGAVCSILLAIGFFLYDNTIAMLYLSACVFTIINFFSNQYIEAYFGEMVLYKKINANIAAKIQQTSIQLAALLGASISGFVIAWGGFLAVLLINMLTYLLGALGFYRVLDIFHIDLVKNHDKSKVVNDRHDESIIISNHSLSITFFLFIILAIVLYSFNFLLPFLVQKDKGWSAIDFGIIDAVAATGALASVIVNQGIFGRICNRMSYFLIIVSLGGFFLTRHPIEAMIMGFLFGFSLNCLRIKVRESIFNNTTSGDLALQFGRKITFINMILRALIPLLLGWLIIQIPASDIFIDLGILCLITFFVLISFSISLVKTNFKNKQHSLGVIK